MNRKSKVPEVIVSALAEKPRTMKELEEITHCRQRTIHKAMRKLDILRVQAGKLMTYELKKR